MKIRPTRLLVWLLVALSAVAIGLALRPAPISADFAAVTRGSLRVTFDEEGETRVRDRFVVSAPLAGRVLRIELEPGDTVMANETVVAIFLPSDPMLLDARARAEAEARVKAAEAAVARARVERTRALAEGEFATSEFQRYVELDVNNLVAKDQLEARELRSPIDGVVLRRLRESESIVPVGEPLLEVADPQELEIVSDLLSTDAVRVNVGDLVLIEQWGGDHTLRGRVRRVEPFGFTKVSALGVEEQRVNVIIDLEDDREAWEALGDGYRVEVRIVVWEQGDVFKIPTSSLFRTDDDWTVYVVRDGRAALRKVEVGARNGFEAEVLSGLTEDEIVIGYPGDAIGDGVQVVERDAYHVFHDALAAA